MVLKLGFNSKKRIKVVFVRNGKQYTSRGLNYVCTTGVDVKKTRPHKKILPGHNISYDLAIIKKRRYPPT